jgi:hypothetical protein
MLCETFKELSGKTDTMMPMWAHVKTGGDEAAPVAPMTPPVDPAAMPTERPSWWPPYLPWPPAPPSAAPMPTYRPPPVAPVMPGQQYSTSYSGLQGAISGAQNPLMMGIGGIIRRP